MANISQIKVGDTVYDIEALRFVAGELNTPAQWKSYIDQMAAIGFDIVVLTTLPEESAASYETYKNNIVLINDSNSITGSSIEYVMVRNGTSGSYTYRWERIGTTTADLNAYAKKGIETLGPSNDSTGSTDIGEKTTSEVAESIAAANVSLKYKLANTTTGSAGGTTTTSTDDAGAHTIDGSNFTFTGTDKAIAVSVNRTADVAVDDHSYTPVGTVNISHNAIKDVTLSANTTTSAGAIKYVESVSHTGASLTGTTSFNTDAIKSATLSTSTTTSTGAIKYVESVTHTAASLKGTTTFNTDAIKDVTLSASTTSSDGPSYVESITYTAASLGGTKTFVTGYNGFSGGSGALEAYDAESNGTRKVANGKRIPYISSLTYTPASLGNASTGTVGISGGSYNGTTKYMKVSTTNADTGTVSINGGSGNLTIDTTSTNGIGVVTSQGSFSAGSLPSLTITSKSPSKISSWSAGTMFNASVSGNILVLTAGSAPSLSYAAESVGSASGWSAGSLPSLGSATTKYLHHSHNAASLSGTTTFTTNGIKSVSLGASTTSSDGPAYTESISGSAPSLTGTKTFVTGYSSFSGGSMSPTTYYLAHGHTSASLGSASTGTVSINGGSVTPTIKYMKKSVTSASTGTVTISGGSITPVIKYANIATTAASKATVTIDGGSVTPVIKYLSKSTVAATLTPSFIGTEATISHTVTQPTFTGTFNNKSIAGTIGGSQSVAGHSHTYVELKEHTHSVSHTDANVSGTVSVPIPAHTHTVVIGSHTHTLNNHTHKQQ